MPLQWKDEELSILKALCEKGINPGKIAKVLKSRSEHAIRHKATELGFPVNQSRSIDYDYYRELLKCEEVA